MEQGVVPRPDRQLQPQPLPEPARSGRVGRVGVSGEPVGVAAADVGQRGVDTERRADLATLIEVIRPVMQADGGDLELVDVDTVTGVVQVRLTGACGSCAVSSVTLSAGVERIFRQRLDWVTEVVGAVVESDDQGFGGWVPSR